jgi:hypothetical protein
MSAHSSLLQLGLTRSHGGILAHQGYRPSWPSVLKRVQPLQFLLTPLSLLRTIGTT